MNALSKDSVTWERVGEEAEDQRIDNFLAKKLKGVPKSHLYRILRTGEVRVNSRRVDAAYRLKAGDTVRLPPVRTGEGGPRAGKRAPPGLSGQVIYEDDFLLALDKPAGVAVHGGSGIATGVVEALREEREGARFLELVHRLDRDTSGVLLLAKKRSALTALHREMREGRIEKRYLALVKGDWRNAKQSVRLPLEKYLTRAGERRVSVSRQGQPAHTVFYLQKSWRGASLLEAELLTGRTHQIRVHLSHLGFPIAGDAKYGDFAWNRELARQGLKRMFLHAARIAFDHPATGERLTLEAPLPGELMTFLSRLSSPATHAETL